MARIQGTEEPVFTQAKKKWDSLKGGHLETPKLISSHKCEF